MQNLTDCPPTYRERLRQVLRSVGVASNPDVTDEWILSRLSELLTRRRPGMGVLLIVSNPDMADKILFGRRKGGTGDKAWCLPGGELEFGEELEEGARRELREETGIQVVENLELIDAINDIDTRAGQREHFIHFLFRAKSRALPRLTEPDKFYSWAWFRWSHLPSVIFERHMKSIRVGARAFQR